ncbi:MAG: oxidoreductase [Usitatibacter sp.]
MDTSVMFQPTSIKNVRFKNRLLRSSIGGRMSNYDGTVTDVWKNFEKRFAEGGVGGIISTTFHVNKDRLSPLQYPSIAEDRFVPYLRKYIAGIREAHDCRYIVQIGDPGYAAQTSLFPEEADGKSSSSGFDLVFGYTDTRTALTEEEIETAVADFARAAARVAAAGADGIEITAAKGYLIHQFLNPGINRRTDQWGGDADRRFQFLERIVKAVRATVGDHFLLGIRLSAADYNYSPLLFLLARQPWVFGSAGWMGNGEAQMLDYARRLSALGVDYLHVVSGFGFPCPRDVSGEFPLDEIRMFFNSTRHLSFKAAVRATLLNAVPAPIARWVGNFGWSYRAAINFDAAKKIKDALGEIADRPAPKVIVNGGFQEREDIERALSGCDMVSMARALIANPDLPRIFERGDALARSCTHCNRCVGRTATSPLGCYEPSRFASQKEMVDQIMQWNQPDPAD